MIDGSDIDGLSLQRPGLFVSRGRTKKDHAHRSGGYCAQIFLAYRHGLRAAEVVDLPCSRSTSRGRRWEVKNGTPPVFSLEHSSTGAESNGAQLFVFQWLA